MVAIRSTEFVARAQIVRIHGVVGVFDGVTDRVETVLEMEWDFSCRPSPRIVKCSGSSL